MVPGQRRTALRERGHVLEEPRDVRPLEEALGGAGMLTGIVARRP
jgi:hypothetical protein